MVSRTQLARQIPQARVGDCYRHAGNAFLANLPLLLGFGIALALIRSATDSMLAASGLIGLVGLAFAIFVALPARWGFYGLCLRAVWGEPVEGADILNVRDNYREIVIGGVVVTLLVIAGLILLVVPGVIVYLRTRFVPYLIVEEQLDARTAIRESFRLTQGLESTIFGICAAGIGLSFAGLLCFVVGVVPAVIWWDLAMASLYHAEVMPPDHELEAEFG